MSARSASGSRLQEYRRKRDFSRTPEPAGDAGARDAGGLAFVVQKHAASHLHFDLRLELDGVMKSWAVPKGPSLDPGVKRLAVEVEDHPMDYNTFEGTIPQGEYGGGTVLLWDRGTYEPDDLRAGEDPERALRRGYHQGKLSFTLHGERLQGSFALVRTHGAEGEKARSQWLLIKHDDAYAEPERDVVAEAATSVESGRTMEEIAAGKGRRRVWRSNRSGKPRMGSTRTAAASSPAADGDVLAPMLCESARDLPEGEGWTYEPKYDGIRVIAYATADAASLRTRNGNEKAKQFPALADALRALALASGVPLVLDGEIVGLDAGGEFLRFESLQGRMHVTNESAIRRHAEQAPAALVAFDLLLAGPDVLLRESWTERRRRLEELLGNHGSGEIRLAETSADGEAMLSRAERSGWEGLVAKRTGSVYRPGKRSGDWRKIKLEARQEFVVGGWTEPRGARPHLGALLLGYYTEDGDFVYAGHTGTGFSQASLAEVHRRLRRLKRKTPPFRTEPSTNEPAHWTTPRLVVEIRFNEWTRDGKLRQPVFLGIREDRDAKEVRRETGGGVPATPAQKRGREQREAADGGGAGAPRQDPLAGNPRVERIRSIQRDSGDGELRLGQRASLSLSNLNKVFYPGGITKGDLLAYYAGMADLILPWMEDRPLVLKRYPNGIQGKSFYQQSAPEDVPAGVRVEQVQLRAEKEPGARLVGGSLATLLYTIQLGAVSYDPWHSRVGSLDSADYTILDLDPGPGASFRRVVQVARWVREEMEAFGLHGALKTSGSRGLHIYLPLPPATPLEAATLIAQILATRVAQKHPGEATVERLTRNRPRGTVYIDYLQNILGKTVAGVYAVRAKPGATVSTPLRWDELTDDLDLREFTVDSVPARVRELGDLWTPAMREPNALDALLAGADG